MRVETDTIVDALEAFDIYAQGIARDLFFGWWWDEEDRVYRNDESGEVMDEYRMISLRDDIVDWQVDYFAKWPIDEKEKEKKKKDDPNILALLLLGIIALGTWEAKMRQALQDASVIQYVFGRGGFEQMTAADWNWLENWLIAQYSFLGGFSNDIAKGLLSEAQIAARSYLYFSSAVTAFENGRMKAQSEELDLTRHPGDYTSQCGSRDRCYWHYAHHRDRIVCHWFRTARESCDTCISREKCPPVTFVKETGEHINMICYEQADAA